MQEILIKKEEWLQDNEGLYCVNIPFQIEDEDDDVVFTIDNNSDDIIQKYLGHFLVGDFNNNVCTLKSDVSIEDDLIVQLENVNNLPGKINYFQDSEGNEWPFYDDSEYLISMAEAMNNMQEEAIDYDQQVIDVEHNVNNNAEFCECEDVVVSEYCSIKEIRNKVGSVIEVFENGDVKIEIDNKLYIVEPKYLHEA